MALFLLVLLVISIGSATGVLHFGFYDANVSATPYATIYQASSIADANDTFTGFRVPSLLLVYDAVFASVPNHLILRPDWEAELEALMSSAAPLLQSGAILGYNIGDELVWNCLAPSNLTLVANAIRARCPRGECTLWYNEAAVFHTPVLTDSCGNAVTDYSIPAALDWFSTDIYHMDGLVEGWVNEYVKGFYEAWIYPNITAEQRVVLVPGSFGSNVNHYPNGTYVCDKDCYDAMCAHDAADFAAWAAADARIAGIFPWNWGGCASCNGSHWTPPHTCCMDELGTNVQPKTAAAWQALFGEAVLEGKKSLFGEGQKPAGTKSAAQTIKVPLRSAPKTAGFNFVAEGFEGPLPYDDPASLASLSIAVAAGVNAFTLSFPWYIAHINSTGPIYPVPGGCPTGAPFNNASSPSNASIVTAIRHIHSLGAAVVLRPMIDPQWSPSQHGDSTWRGAIGTAPPFTPTQWEAFFDSYSNWMLSWAALAEAEGVETLCIGAELASTEPQEALWRALFAAVRAIYKGTVYYSSTGSDLAWWNASDFIAQDMYPSLTNATVNPDEVTVEQLVGAWASYLVYYHDMSVRHNKTVLLQETGICSVNKRGLYNSPAFFECYGLPIDQSVQAKYYEAIFQAVYPLPWIEGVTFWKWSAQGGPNDPTFFPLNKTAMQIVQQYLRPPAAAAAAEKEEDGDEAGRVRSGGI